MGLAGRKVKQRIPYDPRNLDWAENATKFGHAYLSKLGWDASKGLGTEQDGRTTNIAVIQKLDQLGIGAGGPSGGKDTKDGVAWKQQMEFERMLARLNATTEGEGSTRREGVVETLGFVVSGSEQAETTTVAVKSTTITTEVDTGSSSDSKKKKKKEKKRKYSEVEDDVQVKPPSPEPVPTPPTPVVPPRRFAHHRARLLHSKNIASKSAADISAILGIASSSASPAPTSDPSQATLTPISDEPDTKITTSTKSMSDYFKEKMAGMKKRHGFMRDADIDTGAMEVDGEEEEEERPRIGMGLGFGSKSASAAANPFVKPSFEAAPSASASSSSSPTPTPMPSFAPASTSTTALTTPSPETLGLPPLADESLAKRDKKSKKKDKSKSKPSSSSDVPSNPELALELLPSSSSKKDKKESKKSRDTSDAAPAHTVAVDEPKKKKRRKDADGAMSSLEPLDVVVPITTSGAVEVPGEDVAEAKRRRKEEKRAKKAAKEAGL